MCFPTDLPRIVAFKQVELLVVIRSDYVHIISLWVFWLGNLWLSLANVYYLSFSPSLLDLSAELNEVFGFLECSEA